MSWQLHYLVAGLDAIPDRQIRRELSYPCAAPGAAGILARSHARPSQLHAIHCAVERHGCPTLGRSAAVKPRGRLNHSQLGASGCKTVYGDSMNVGGRNARSLHHDGEVLVAETVGLIRAAVAEARRFPDLAASVSRMGLERGTEAVTQLLASLRNPTKYRRSRPTAAPPPRAIISAADADACAVRRAPHSAARRDRAACRANGGVLSCCMQTGRNWLD